MTRSRLRSFAGTVGILAVAVLVPTTSQALPTDDPSDLSALRQRWAARYDTGPGTSNFPSLDGAAIGDVASGIAVSPDGGRVYVTGYSVTTRLSGGTYSDLVTLAYDAITGKQVWIARYPGDGDEIAVSPDGTRVYVTGSSSGYDMLTVAYDAATGARIWAVRSGYGSGTAIAVSPDGTRVFAINTFGHVTVAFDGATGAHIWSRLYAGPGDNDGAAYALAVSPDGTRVFVTGTTHGRYSWISADYATVSYDSATGAQIWSMTYNGPDNLDDAPTGGLGVSSDGARVFVAGRSRVSGQYDYATLAYDAATGEQIWTARYSGPDDESDSPAGLKVSPDGARIYVTGRSQSGSGASSRYATLAYDATTGAQIWVTRYNGLGDSYDLATDVVVSPDGVSVYVTGSQQGPASNNIANNNDVGTVAYDADTGTQLWDAGYTGPGLASSGAMAVSPDGSHVYVAGYQTGIVVTPLIRGDNRDFLTVAYCTRPSPAECPLGL